MSKFKKKPVVIEASQWFKNGDHPLDYAKDIQSFDGEIWKTWTGAEAREKGWEGQIVRYFRNPSFPGSLSCHQCGKTMHDHGWIDTLEGDHRVCPGDWIITGIKG